MSEKLRMETADLSKEKRDLFYQLFPNCITEAIVDDKVRYAINVKALENEINAHVAEDGEIYQFTWPGKDESMILADEPVQLCLRPCKEISQDFDNTRNVYIKGDNIDALKLLRETYYKKIKMIYIDPPYNTGNDSFVYGDDYRLSLEEYSDISGEYSDEGFRLTSNPSNNGQIHTDWLNMIYPRLKLARDLLKDDGAIFIHIDEHEVSSLQLICREIFGESNEQGTIVWDKRNPKGSVAGVAYQHEYILVYSKNPSKFVESDFSKVKEHAKMMIDKSKALIKKFGGINEASRNAFREWIMANKDILSGGERAYNLIDDSGRIYQPVSMAAPDKPETRSHRPLIHPITGKPCPVPDKGWRFKDDEMDKKLRENKIAFGDDETTQPRQKYYLDENMNESFSSLLYYGGSDEVYGLPFDNPKPQYICRKIIDSICRQDKNAIILDFFAGSSSTAEAVMSLNAEDHGVRQYILIQIPEKCDEKSDAYKAGFKTICDLGIERIRRACVELKNKNSQQTLDEDTWKLDTGFRVFNVDTTNMKKTYYSPEETTQEKLDDLVDNVKPGRTPDDLLIQTMLELTLPLSSKIHVELVDHRNVFIVNDGELVACFDISITEKVVEFVARCAKSYAVFRDASIESDSVATNFEQIFKTYNPDVIRKVI